MAVMSGNQRETARDSGGNGIFMPCGQTCDHAAVQGPRLGIRRVGWVIKGAY